MESLVAFLLITHCMLAILPPAGSKIGLKSLIKSIPTTFFNHYLVHLPIQIHYQFYFSLQVIQFTVPKNLTVLEKAKITSPKHSNDNMLYIPYKSKLTHYKVSREKLKSAYKFKS